MQQADCPGFESRWNQTFLVRTVEACSQTLSTGFVTDLAPDIMFSILGRSKIKKERREKLVFLSDDQWRHNFSELRTKQQRRWYLEVVAQFVKNRDFLKKIQNKKVAFFTSLSSVCWVIMHSLGYQPAIYSILTQPGLGWKGRKTKIPWSPRWSPI